MKTVHDLANIAWHLQNNVWPPLTEKAVNGIIAVLKELNEGKTTVYDEIAEGASVCILDMCGDLKIDLTEE